MKYSFLPQKLLLASILAFPFLSYAEEVSDNHLSLFDYVIQLNQIQLHDGKSVGKTLTPVSYENNELNLWSKIRRRFTMQEVSSETVEKFERYYAKHPEYFARTVMRASPYLHHIYTEVEKRNMPGEIALLPFIESAFVIRAKSHAGAMGIWQFMPKTGKRYGLTQNNWYDGRNDIYASTDAALSYLQTLHKMFGDWALALAAYNCGENCVMRAQRKAEEKGLPTSFEYLELPKETREYVPKLLAVRNLVNNPQAFDIQLKKIDSKPFFEAVKVSHPIDLKAVARLAEVKESEILRLNPGYRVPVWVPQSNRRLLIPSASVSTFYKNLKKANKDDLLSWKPYLVGDENNLETIAKQHGMSLSQLKGVNNVSGSRVAKGSILLVSKKDNSSLIQVSSDDKQPTLTHAVYTSYNDEDDIEQWQEPSYLHSINENSSSNRPVKTIATIKVKKGMTLNSIAKRYNMNVNDLKKLNHLRNNKIKLGQNIKVVVVTKPKSGRTTFAVGKGKKGSRQANLVKVKGKGKNKSAIKANSSAKKANNKNSNKTSAKSSSKKNSKKKK